MLRVLTLRDTLYFFESDEPLLPGINFKKNLIILLVTGNRLETYASSSSLSSRLKTFALSGNAMVGFAFLKLHRAYLMKTHSSGIFEFFYRPVNTR